MDKPQEMKTGCFEAMTSLFELFEAVHNNDLTVQDLTKAVKFSIDDGHEMLQIVLVMVRQAVENGQSEKEGGQ